eukprot:scaffold71517_cov23-Tisochrysis_lutea.AAC.1
MAAETLRAWRTTAENAWVQPGHPGWTTVTDCMVGRVLWRVGRVQWVQPGPMPCAACCWCSCGRPCRSEKGVRLTDRTVMQDLGGSEHVASSVLSVSLTPLSQRDARSQQWSAHRCDSMTLA